MPKEKTIKKKAFNNFRHNGIHLTFPNGNSLSTIWGRGSYTENHDVPDWNTFYSSNTVEVMIMEAPEKLLKKIHRKFADDGAVITHLTMENWLWIIKQLILNPRTKNGKRQ